MLLIAGTLPVPDMPLIKGPVGNEGEFLVIDGHRLSRTQGTGAMIAAALAATEYLKLEPPTALVAGDIGAGRGSREIYRHLIGNITKFSPAVLALHYWLPDMVLTRQMCQAVGGCAQRPVMLADAGSMYSAKAAGMAGEFDIFTPDATEMAFLADPRATHPAYIAQHLFHTDTGQTPELVKTAYGQGNTARLTITKGATDYIFRDGEVTATVTGPDVPALEAIGGTGDTITGLVAALVFAGFEPQEAALVATRTNRAAGELAEATPATRVGQIIDHFPAVFRENL